MEGEPEITSPVMRFLTVQDVAGSSAFYRDVLGFEVTEAAGAAEAILGPARIQLEENAHARGDGGTPRLPGSAVLFLQTGDVAATRAAILARGAIPSEIEKVNWIKMRMFEVRDPDGRCSGLGKPTTRNRIPLAAADRSRTGCGKPCLNCRSTTCRLPLPTIALYWAFGSTIGGMTLACWIAMRLQSCSSPALSSIRASDRSKYTSTT